MNSQSSLSERHSELSASISESAKKTLATLESKFSSQDSLPDTSKGLSFLELKNNLMLDYLINLTFITWKKTLGKKIQGDPAVERIVEIRTFLEKLRPLESKLKYQIEKSVKVADAGALNPSDPIHFKPNPSQLASKLNEEENDDEDSDEDVDDDKAAGNGSDGLYKVPKNIPAYFDDERDDEASEEAAKRKKRMSQSLLEDLKRQHLDTPEEEFNMADTMRAKQIQEYKERIRFEEDNFIRMPMSKKDKHKNRKQRFSTVNTLGDELTTFGTNLFDDNSDSKTRGKKRKAGSVKKGAAKKKFKRRK